MDEQQKVIARGQDTPLQSLRNIVNLSTWQETKLLRYQVRLADGACILHRGSLQSPPLLSSSWCRYLICAQLALMSALTDLVSPSQVTADLHVEVSYRPETYQEHNRKARYGV